MGELVPLSNYAARKSREERVAANDAVIREIWAREEGRLLWQALWRSHPKRRRRRG
jgi:hypothetical protein